MTRLLFVLFLVLGFLGVDFASQHSAVSIPAISVLSNKDKLQPYNESWKWNSFTRNDSQWVDSVYNTLAQDERLGQMFMVAAFSNKGPEHISYIDSLILNQKIGGLIFFQGSPIEQILLINRYQAESKIPLLIGMDAEWGLTMRLSETMKFPYQITLGAIQNDSLIFETGRAIARQLKRVGVHFSFSPVVDVNNNPSNPVINFRSFGEDVNLVSQKGLMYMKGLQKERVLACAKHFPGHGDTDTDSHLALPIITASRSRLDSLELKPFDLLIKNGVMSTMIAHLSIPSLDSTPNLPSTLSRNIVTNILRDSMKFNGLIVTDALNMKGISINYAPGEIELKAVLAGNDMLLYPEDVPKAIAYLMAAIENGVLSWANVEQSVKRILFAKKWANLDRTFYLSAQELDVDLHQQQDSALIQNIYANALTLVKGDVLQIRQNEVVKIIAIGDATNSEQFMKAVVKHKTVVLKQYDWDTNGINLLQLKEDLASPNVLLSIHVPSQRNAGNYRMTQQVLSVLKADSTLINATVVLFGNPYTLTEFLNAPNILCAYEDVPYNYPIAAAALFAQGKMPGKLPISIPGLSLVNQPVTTDGLLDTEPNKPTALITHIDQIVNNAIEAKAMPGCQVFVSQNGKTLLNKAYGNHTYNNQSPTQISDIYDIASLTKICASTLSLMKLMDEGKIDLNKTLSHYLSYLKGTNKADLTLKEVLSHQAGLRDWIPFYLETITANGKLDNAIYSNTYSSKFSVQVADSLFIIPSFKKLIYDEITYSPIKNRGTYLYSDLGYFYIKEIVERLTKMPINEYVYINFYQPLGLATTGYLPLQRFEKSRIVPSENDVDFRQRVVWGYVHDPAAAQMGGVAGHAGVFSSAQDVATIMTMLCNYGVYNNRRYITEKTVKTFNTSYFIGNRRAICFDKPEPNSSKTSPCSAYASPTSFGHSGFTGCFAWADPENGMVYVFLSNRTYPSSKNKKLISLNVRTNIQDEVYQYINKIK